MSDDADRAMGKSMWIDRALVVSPYYIGLCKTADQFKRELKRMGLQKSEWPYFIREGSNATVHSFECGGKLSAIVCIRKPKGISRHQLNALIVHEAVHVWQWIRECIGENHPSKEFEAYSIQSISQGLMVAYWGDK